MASAPFPCTVHFYDSPTANAAAYEIGPSGVSNAILFIGGLSDGPHTVFYTPTLAKYLETSGQDWSLFEIRMRSSFSGYGYSSLKNDVEDISALVRYLRSIGKKKIVLMGHSTGCQVRILALGSTMTTIGSRHQDCMEYSKLEEDVVDGFILQGPVSDRESIVDFVKPEDMKKGLDLAAQMIAEGKGGEILPADYVPSIFNTPITAYRWHSLTTKG